MASTKFDDHAPPLAKQVLTQVHIVINQTTQLAKEVVHQARAGGPLAAAQYAANESKELVLNQSVKIFSKIDNFPLIHMITEMTVPTAAHWSEKYNNFISDLRGKGYDVFSYVPLIPIDEITKAFKQSEGGHEGGGGGGAAADDDVDDSSDGEMAESQ